MPQCSANAAQNQMLNVAVDVNGVQRIARMPRQPIARAQKHSLLSASKSRHDAAATIGWAPKLASRSQVVQLQCQPSGGHELTAQHPLTPGSRARPPSQRRAAHQASESSAHCQVQMLAVETSTVAHAYTPSSETITTAMMQPGRVRHGVLPQTASHATQRNP
jgi:hypothetical protein